MDGSDGDLDDLIGIRRIRDGNWKISRAGGKLGNGKSLGWETVD